MAGITTIAKLREHNLRQELDSLRILLTDIRRLRHTSGRPKWLAVVVNKVDLFRLERIAALQYYHPGGSGAFGRELAEFQRDVGNQNVAVYLLEACAFEKDFEWNGEKVKSSLERQQQNAILREFMTTISAITEFHS